jgi:hypothetical protein
VLRQCGCDRRRRLLILDLDEVHAGVLEKLEVPVNRCLTGAVLRLKVQENAAGV